MSHDDYRAGLRRAAEIAAEKHLHRGTFHDCDVCHQADIIVDAIEAEANATPSASPGPAGKEEARPCASAACYMLCGRLCSRPFGHDPSTVHRCADHQLGWQDAALAPKGEAPAPGMEPCEACGGPLVRRCTNVMCINYDIELVRGGTP